MSNAFPRAQSQTVSPNKPQKILNKEGSNAYFSNVNPVKTVESAK